MQDVLTMQRLKQYELKQKEVEATPFIALPPLPQQRLSKQSPSCLLVEMRQLIFEPNFEVKTPRLVAVFHR